MIKEIHVSVWNWIERFGSCNIYKRKNNSLHNSWNSHSVWQSEFWLRICIESRHKSVLEIYISKERNILVAEKFIRSLVGNYGKHTVYSDGGTWYLEACNVLKLKHYLHSPFQKVDGKSQPVLRGQNQEFWWLLSMYANECNLFHAYNWIQFFVSMYNDTTFENYFINELDKEAEYILN